MADFLLEIGLEEIPARMIAGAEAELGKRVTICSRASGCWARAAK
jgi:glycyl-tRNA synthetase beta subunit